MVTQYRYVEMERKAGFDPSWDFDVIGNVFYQFSIDFHSDIKCCTGRHRLTHVFKLAAILLLIYFNGQEFRNYIELSTYRRGSA
jgi:hypothetical protein